MNFDPAPFLPYVTIIGLILTILINKKKLNSDHDQRVEMAAVSREQSKMMNKSIRSAHVKIRALQERGAALDIHLTELQASLDNQTAIITRMEGTINRHMEQT